MKQMNKHLTGLLVMAVISAVILSACLPLPSTPEAGPQGSASPPAVETAAPQETQPPAPETAATPTTQVAATPATQAAATPAALPSPGTPLEGTLWGLVSYAGADGKTVDVLPDTAVTAQFADGSVSGSGGCNNYFAKYQVDGNQLTVGVGGATMMACPEPIMAQESAYMANLAASASYVVQEGQLEIAGADGKTLLTYQAIQPTSLTGTVWQLTMYNNGREAVVSTLPGTAITAIFGEDGTLTGSGGCNNYSATYKVDGSSIAVTPVATTSKMCSEPAGVMDQESAYLAALQSAASYSISGSELTILDSNGHTLLHYSAAPPASLSGVTWSLVNYNNGKGGLVSVLNGTEITALFGEDGSLAGSAGCNDYTATYALEGDMISVGPAATTRKMCAAPEGIMDQETAYLAALESAATYKTDGKTLELTNSDGVRVAIYAAKAEPSAQATQEAGTVPAIIGAPWQWAGTLYNDGTAVTPSNPENYQVELLPEGQLKLKADCNTAAGTYTLDGDHISIEVTTSTMMACPEGSLADEFIKDLNAAQFFMMDGEDLIFVLKLDTGNMRLQTPESALSATPSAEPTTPVAAATPEVPATAEAGAGTAEILGVVWKWDSATSADGQSITVDQPQQYEFMLLPTGTIRVKADCNNGSGTFWIQGSSITIEILTLTRAACPPGSLSDDFVQMLNRASTYRVEAGNLHMDSEDGGTMVFSPGE
jgi:heat shock protein HslJ